MEKRMLIPNEIVDETIAAGVKKSKLQALQMIILGIIGGAFIALGGYSAAVASHSIENFGLSKFVAGAVFPVGLMMILLGGGELFTSNTMILIGVVDGKVQLKKMFKNWFFVYFANLIGSVLIAYLIFASGGLDVNGGKLGAYALKVAAYKGSLPFYRAFVSGILCNILVCIAVWMSYGAKDVIHKIFAVWFPIMAFVVAGYEHCVANMYYFSIGLFAKTNPAYAEIGHFTPEKLSHISVASMISNLIPATLGNIVGGAVCIALMYYLALKRIPAKMEVSKSLNM
ncbi:MAG: formate/nitrite transporter family protein [Caloramator sp.]|nr:formate/nitrite transporter family protein [Caloramator sp.]